jgi:pimeloyl-ACP methyl ester carboxylesterase
LSECDFVCVQGRRLEYRYFDPPAGLQAPGSIVMLHEGLGSVAMWKDFPTWLAATTGMRVLAYSRFGHGRSDALSVSYAALHMHEREALEVLPALLRELGIERPVFFGHSDGASIALIYAGAVPNGVAGVIALAPHLFVEQMCIASIQDARRSFLESDLREKLARYHEDPDRTFWTWNDLWLDPSFRSWNIEHYLAPIRCAVLAVQGYQDEYGTMEQLARVARAVPTAQLLKLPDCRHSPHRDQPEALLAASGQFLGRIRA